MTAKLRIRVLGELKVFRAEREIALPPSRKTRALLAYLAVVGRPQRRERLCELFWDVPDDPRGALRWSLSKIRGMLGEDGHRLVADRTAVRLDTAGLDLDFGEVIQARHEQVDLLPTDRLQRLAGQFRGSFLEDLALPRCPEFEAWRTYHADDLDLLRLRILRTLVDRMEDDPEGALPHLRTLRSLDPEDEALALRAEQMAGRVRQNARAPLAASTPPPAHAAPEGAPRRAQQEVRFCTARDGVRLAYAVTGEGPPILRAAHWMSHLQHDWESPVWRHWIEGLSRENRLVRYDERANGLSDWDVRDLSFEAMVEDLETVADAAGLDRFTLLGISQSCAVSVAYAVRHPERVAGLVLYGGYVKGWRKRGNPSEIATREALATLMRVGWGQDNPIFRQLFTSQFIPDASAEQIASFDELQRITVSPENAWRLQNVFGDIDVSRLLHRVEVPTLVIHAGGDRVAPFESGRCFATDIPGARFIHLDSSNHVLLPDEPAFGRLLEEVRSFSAQCGALARERQSVTEQRRPVSVMTGEIVNPASILEYSDPDVAARVLGPLCQQALDIIERHGGTVIEVGPNEFTAAFGLLSPSDDHAAQACSAALALSREVDMSAASTKRIRFGLDTAEARIRISQGPEGSSVDVKGSAIPVSRRLVHALRTDVIAATARAREAAGPAFELVPMDRADCPSFPPDMRVFRLLSARRMPGRAPAIRKADPPGDDLLELAGGDRFGAGEVAFKGDARATG